VTLVHPGLRPGALHQHCPVGAVGLEVDTSDQLVAEQERQHVVAVLALRGRGVDLDPVLEAEGPQGSVSGPDNRVEWAQQGASADPAPQTRLGMEVRRAVPLSHGDGQQATFRHELGQGLLAMGRRETVVVGEIFQSPDSVVPRGQHEQLLAGLVLGQRRAGECLGGDHPFW
jgi:hypothetical protein